MEDLYENDSETLEDVNTILTMMKLKPLNIQFIAKGSSSLVWRVKTAEKELVVRLSVPNAGKAIRFEADRTIRELLRQRDRRVAIPLATNQDYPEAPHTQFWAVDIFIAGVTKARGNLPESVCYDLGELLKELHDIPVEGYGLLENRRDKVVGMADSFASGIQTRLQDPYPFSTLPVEEHPVAIVAPAFLAHIKALRPLILECAESSKKSLVHSDLHEGQLLVKNKSLAALIDFGDAMISHPSLDLASFAYFHGWKQLAMLLPGYSQNDSDQRWKEAQLFSIVIALHHISRSFTLKRPQRREFALQHLTRTFPYIQAI